MIKRMIKKMFERVLGTHFLVGKKRQDVWPRHKEEINMRKADGLRRSLIIASLILVGCILSSRPVFSEGVLPLEPISTAEWEEMSKRQKISLKMNFRGKHIFFINVEEGDDIKVEITSKQLANRYQDPLKYSILDPSGKEIREGRIASKEAETIFQVVQKAGTYQLTVNAGSNAGYIKAANRYIVVKTPVHTIYSKPDIFFYVPKGTTKFTVFLRGGGMAEQAGIDIFSSDGSKISSGETTGGNSKLVLEIDVPEGEAGKIWRAKLRKASTGRYEDVVLNFSEEISPYISADPERLMKEKILTLGEIMKYPAESVTLKILPDPEKTYQMQAELDLHIAPDLLKQSAVVITLFNRQTMKPIKTKRIETPDSNRILFGIPEGISRINLIFTVDLFDGKGEKIAHFTEISPFERIFRENEKPTPLPSLTKRERSRGYLLFTRLEPGDIFLTSVPSREEIIDCLKVSTTPGERTAVNFALYSLTNLKGVKVELNDFKSKDGYRIEKEAVDLRVVRCWPQRTDYNSITYHVIPELLERKERVDIPEGRTQQYYLIINISNDAVSSIYTSNVKIITQDGKAESLKIVLNILPFKLQAPSDIIWGLYSDSWARWRWQKSTDERLLEELIAIRNQGINALTMYPLVGGEFKYNDGKVTADLHRFSKYMALYKRAGLKGPFVMSIQGIDAKIRRWVPNAVCDDTKEYSDQAKNAFQQVIKAIGQEAEKNNWPSFAFHVVDEARLGVKDKEAIRTLGLTKDAGFETFATTYPSFVREVLDPYVDYRCYCNMHYSSFQTKERTAQLRQETLASGDKFWWYGSGCYTKIIQEGNIISNRYLSGFFLWRSKATGAWSWTFNRPKDDPFDDFDGRGKDLCIVYPNPRGGLFIPTLQWEGIREGINDYKYLYTLSVIIEKMKKSKDYSVISEAKRVEKELNQMLSNMPWRHAFSGEYPAGAISNADLNRYRHQIIQWTLDVLTATLG